MSKSHRDQRKHRRKVAGTGKGLTEHRKRDKRRGRNPKAGALAKEETGFPHRCGDDQSGDGKPKTPNGSQIRHGNLTTPYILRKP
jgi:hypothetical protein